MVAFLPISVGDVKDINFDWTGWLAGDSLDAGTAGGGSTWTIEPSTDGSAVSSSTTDGSVVACKVSVMTPGSLYRVTNTIVTEGGLATHATFSLRALK